MFNSKIISCGSYLPNRIVTNFELENTVDTTNQWIVDRTGIKQRHIASKNEMTSDIAYFAAKNAIEQSKIDPNEIEMIVVATTTPDLTFPSTATIVQSKLKIKTGFAFDVQAVCSGFVYALNIANNFIKTGQVKKALVIGADILSRIVDWKDRNTCILFGDGAGAVILTTENDKKCGILSSDIHSNGDYSYMLQTSGGPSFSQSVGFIQMNGKEVFKHAVEKMSTSFLNLIQKNNLSVDDIDWFIPHQANKRILETVAKKLKLDKEKVVITVDKHANTSAASIPLSLDYAMQTNKIKKGDLVVLEALGGGLTWGSILIKW